MRHIEMVGLVNGERFTGCDAGADGAGAGAGFRPFRAKIKPSLAQIIVEGGIAQELDRHALPIGKEEDVILLGHLPVKPFQAGAGDVHEVFRLLTMLAKTCLGDDDRFARLGRIKLIGVETTPPGFQHHRIPAGIPAPADGLDFLDMIRKTHKPPALDSRLP